MLTAENIDAGYGDIQVLWDISFHVDRGEFVVLVGANGAGKTTIMKTISRLVSQTRGVIQFDGMDLDSLPPYRVTDIGIAHVPEGRQLFPEMTVRENLEIGALGPRARRHRADTLEHVLDLFPQLRQRQKQLAGTMSGGEQQMLAIGRGLMSLPKMVLFDEPSLGLAPVMTQEVFRLARKIHGEGMTLLMVEQNVRQTLNICDRAYVLENGTIVLEGKGGELLENEEVKRAFLAV
jgi:branched-chain amino acid transport system ATP-binding protein